MRSVIDIVDLTVEEIDSLLKTAMDMIKNPKKYAKKCKGKKIATLFFEPSTRTRLSFEAAMLELGGSAIGFSSPSSSSASKGESVSDTAMVISKYADIIAMRHPKEGAPLVAALGGEIPVINAGDGGHCHPTQTLADLLTITREKGRINNLTIGFCGDLKYGRTVHSLIGALSRYTGIKIVLISPKELKVPSYVKEDILNKFNMEYAETQSLEDALPNLDVLYMTRIQEERFTDKEEYNRLKDSYVLNKEKLDKAKEDTIVLHPLPRVNEISVDVDSDKRACYFKQVENGKIMRKALILMLLNDVKKDKAKFKLNDDKIVYNKFKCKNPVCISKTEQELTQMARLSDMGEYRCVYCDKKVK